MKRGFNKKGIALEQLTVIILLLIALVVLLVVTGQVGKVLEKIAGKEQCSYSFLISSWSKKGTGIDIIPPECAHQKITITKKEIDDNKNKITKEMEKTVEVSKKYSATNQYAKEYVDHFADENSAFAEEQKRLTEWYIDQQISNELKRCWEVTGRGQLDLFSNWWSLLECKADDKEKPHPCTYDEMKEVYNTWWGKTASFVGTFATFGATKKIMVSAGAGLITPLMLNTMFSEKMDVNKKPPVYCVLCTRIKFDDDVQTQLGKTEIKSIPNFLANNHIPNSATSYAEYLKNYQISGLYANGQYTYITNESYAIVYQRINTFGLIQYYNNIKSTINGFIDSPSQEDAQRGIVVLRMIPYNTLPNECTYLVG